MVGILSSDSFIEDVQMSTFFSMVYNAIKVIGDLLKVVCRTGLCCAAPQGQKL